MTLLSHIPPDTGVSLLCLCKAADLFPIECRQKLQRMEAAGQVESYPDGRTTLWRRMSTMQERMREAGYPSPLPPPRRPTITSIIRQCEREASLPLGAILSKVRAKPVAQARQAAAARLRSQRGMSYPEIATALNLKSHTSAMYAVRRHEQRKDEQ